MKVRALAAAAAALALASGAALAQQGVSKTEIVIGSIQDLSGPLAGFGKQVRLGMMLRVDEINEQGGIHGRKLKLVVEASAYDPKKAVLGRAKARQPGQDLRHGRHARPRRSTWRRCRCSSRRTFPTASTERSAVLSDAFSRGLTKLRSSRNSSGSTSSSFEQMGESLNRLDQIAKGVADSTGLSQSQVASIAFGVSGRLGLETGVASASVHANGGKAYQSSLTADERKVLSTMSSEQLAEFKQFGDRVPRDASFMNVVAKDSREAHDMVARLASTHARSERAEASLAERTAFAERVSAAHEKGESISIDIAQDPLRSYSNLRKSPRGGQIS